MFENGLSSQAVLYYPALGCGRLDGGWFIIGRANGVPWEFGLNIYRGLAASPGCMSKGAINLGWKGGTCHAYRGRGETEGKEKILYREKQIDKISGVTVLVIKSHPYPV